MDSTTLVLWALGGFCVVGAGICCLLGIVWLVRDGQERTLRNRNITGQPGKRGGARIGHEWQPRRVE
jgi:hypothetical protein